MSGDQIRALLVFHSLDTALSLRALLAESADDSFVFHRAERADEALRRVAHDHYDVVIADLNQPDSTGSELVARLREAAPRIPVVVVSERDEVAAGIEVVRAGAQDYITSEASPPGAVYRAVRFAIERARLSGEVSRHTTHQLELKDQFLSQFSHELRSPITAIYQFITILLDGLAGDLTQEQREYLEITLRNINLMRDMIRDLMDVSRAQTGKLTIRPRCTSVVTIIAETAAGLQTAANARNILLAPVDLRYVPPVMADPGRMRQVLNNLCDNALKFCGAGDTITLNARLFEHDANLVCISVGDTGCGISDEGRQQVFEYLYQDQAGLNYNQRGLGIGLAICKELVMQHGGNIWVESEPGKGSIFSFTLPRVKLTDLAAQVCSESAGEAAQLQLLEIEVSNAPEAKFPLSESSRQRIWDYLDRSARAGSELVIPRVCSRPDRELLFLLSSGPDQASAQRVRDRLLQDAQVDEAQVDIRVVAHAGCGTVAPKCTGDSYDMQDICERIEEIIENRIRH